MFIKISLVLFTLNSVFVNTFVATDETVVKTSSGLVKGNINIIFNKSIEVFLGIPFAEPPVGSLRFAKPKPITKPIEGVIDATKPNNDCFQGGNQGGRAVSEDCLVLNIWTEKRETSTKLKPVMFWIYGGSLKSGSINVPVYTGNALVTYDVVFVSTNYRLGHLGFLYGGDESAPGNVGLYDQLLALKWVRENIHMFGGDKDQITIFGESAGSWSVSAQVLSPLTKGLFKRAIMESGAHFYNKDRPVISKEEALNNAKQLAKKVNCSDEKHWLECLRKVDPKHLLPGGEFIFPVDGTEFLPLSGQKAFSSMNFSNDIDLMAGINQGEGSLAKSYFHQVKNNFTEKMFEELVDFAISIYHNMNKEKIIKFYLDKVDTKNVTALRDAFYSFFGDVVIKCPTYRFAKKFAEKAQNKKAYFYELTYEGKLAALLGCNEKTDGVCHGADVEFVFGMPIITGLSPKIDVDFSREVMKMWTNFAKTGDPGDDWPLLKGNTPTVIKNLNPHDLKGVLNEPFKMTCDQFWDEYYG